MSSPGGGPLPRRVGGRVGGTMLGLALFLRRGGRPRPGEVEPDPRKYEVPSDPRAEIAVIVLMMLSCLSGFSFFFAYIFFDSTQFLGLTLGLALVFAAIGAVIAGKNVVPQEIHVEERPRLTKPDVEDEVQYFVDQSGEGVTRRKLLKGSAGAAGAGIGFALIVPAASFGPKVGQIIAHTPWHRGRYLVDERGNRMTADDIDVGEFVTRFPEGASREELGSPIIVVRMKEEELHLPPERRDWAPKGILAFSKICTHAGCAISMFRYPLYPELSKKPALVCPCHYSTFTPQDGGNVKFGPAGRPLPQLPLGIDARGEIHADGPYSGAPGPAWWSAYQTKPS